MHRLKKLASETLIIAAASVVFTGCSALLDNQQTVTKDQQGNSVTNDFFVPSQTAQNVISAGKAVAPALPVPYNAAAEGVLALATAGLGILAAAKNKKLNSANNVISAVVAGVESAANQAQTGDKLKATIQSHASAAGVQQLLDSHVQQVTGGMLAKATA